MGWAGAAGGAAKSLREILAEREQKRLDLQAQANVAAQRATQAEQFAAQQAMQGRRLAIDEQQLAHQQAQDVTTADRVDADRRQKTNAREVQRIAIAGLRAKSMTPEAAGLLAAEEGAPIDPDVLDPGRTQRERIELENLRSANDLKQITARGAGGDPLRDELTRLRIDQEKEKLDAAKAKNEQERQWREKTGEDAKRVTQTAYDLATRLETHPGLAKSQGAYELRGFTQDAKDFRGIRAQLVAALALPNLGALKGPMSDKDIIFVKNLATRLENDSLSDDEALRAVREAKTFLESKGAVPHTSAAGGRRYYDANGNPVPR